MVKFTAMYWVFFMIGAMVPCFILARGFRWALRKWRKPGSWILTSHALAFVSATILAAWGDVVDGSPDFAAAASKYIIPQLLLVVVDLVNERRGRTAPLTPS